MPAHQTQEGIAESGKGKAQTARLRGTQPASVSDERRELIELCVRGSQLLGVPKSVGEIYGLVFSSNVPLTFEDVVAGLGISNGSASQGLRMLRRMGAVRTCYVAQERRDFYVAETSLKRLLGGALGEMILLHLGGAGEQLRQLRERLNEGDSPQKEELAKQAEILSNWSAEIRTAMNAALGHLS